MFVQTTQNKPSSTSSRKNASDRLKEKESIPSNQTFLDILESIVPSNQESTRELNELWKDLPDLEKALIANPNHKNLSEYKEHIKQIAQLILKKNHKVIQVPSRGRNDTKDIRYVKILDDKLDLLANTMFSPTNSAFAILKQLDEIRGLLIDLKG
jgi:uncharacterized protein YaaR (DUF327 family)